MITTLIGVIGLLVISLGVILKKRKKQDLYYILGGILLLVYSIQIKNSIFIILQIVFLISASYDFTKNKK